MPDDRYGLLSTYLRDPIIDFLASSAALRISSYTLSAYDITADANGDKVVLAGTVLTNATSNPAKAMPRPTGSDPAIGICTRAVNVRQGDADVGLMTAGHVNTNRIWDAGVFGAVESRVKTDLPHIVFETYSG